MADTNEETKQPDLTSFWSQQYEEAVSGGSQNFLFPKEEVTRVRLIGLGNNPNEWFQKVDNEYQGKITPKFLVKGYRVVKPGESGESLLQAVVLSKGTWGHIANMSREGYDFFSPEGLAIIIYRQNNGGRISYSVMPSPVPVPIPPDILTVAQETPWSFYVEEYAKMQEGRGDDNNASPASPAGPSVADQILNSPKTSADW